MFSDINFTISKMFAILLPKKFSPVAVHSWRIHMLSGFGRMQNPIGVRWQCPRRWGQIRISLFGVSAAKFPSMSCMRSRFRLVSFLLCLRQHRRRGFGVLNSHLLHSSGLCLILILIMPDCALYMYCIVSLQTIMSTVSSQWHVHGDDVYSAAETECAYPWLLTSRFRVICIDIMIIRYIAIVYMFHDIYTYSRQLLSDWAAESIFSSPTGEKRILYIYRNMIESDPECVICFFLIVFRCQTNDIIVVR